MWKHPFLRYLIFPIVKLDLKGCKDIEKGGTYGIGLCPYGSGKPGERILAG